jgi:hypothetical protein
MNLCLKYEEHFHIASSDGIFDNIKIATLILQISLRANHCVKHESVLLKRGYDYIS